MLKQLKKQKVEDLFDIAKINPHRCQLYTEWVEHWEEAMGAFENFQWRRATNNFELVLERMSEIPGLYPGPPDEFTMEKLRIIKEWKESTGA